MRERQARYKEEMKAKMEEEKRKRADVRAREKERKKEEQKIAKANTYDTIQWQNSDLF